VPGSSTANGVWIDQWTCVWSSNEQWAFQGVS
jgi:hypothetical protein